MLLENDRLARRLALECDLERYTARSAFLREKVEQAESARAKAAAALNAAKAALNAEEAALASAQRLCRTIDAECASIRQLVAFDPAVVDTLPSELLQAIWGHMCATSEYEARWRTIEDERYDDDRAALPCQIAAVCRRWRYIALRTPELWTYIAIPSYKSYNRQRQPLLYHVQHQLERSHSLGLDLFLLRGANNWYDVSASRSSRVEEILLMASEHSQRWLSLKVKFAATREAESLARLMVDRPTPLLEELYVAGPKGAEVPWFSSTPSLKALVSASLTLDSVEAVNSFRDALRALPSLVNLSLDLGSGFEEFDPNSGPKLSLHSLVNLKLRGRIWMFEDIVSHIIISPRLRKLNIRPEMVDPDWGSRFFTAYPDVTTLEFDGDGYLTIPRIRALTALKRVQRLSLINCRFGRSSHDLLFSSSPGYPSRCAMPSQKGSSADSDSDIVDSENGFFNEDDASRPGLSWPELQSLTIFSPLDAGDQLLDDILFFSRERAAACEARGISFQLSLLSWRSPFPSWFREALGYLLGPDNVYLTTADGISHAPLADDVQEEETEAEFTDSESALNSDDASSGDETDYDRLDVHSDEDEE